MSASMKQRTSSKQGNNKKSPRPKHDRSPKNSQDDVNTHVPKPHVWSPSTHTAFKALLSARLCAAIWSHITDCDETFNYWEPLHYLVYGHGFQTWEYSPVYAIRSYAYVWLYSLGVKLFTAIAGGRLVLQFYFLRAMMGTACAFCEVFLYKAVCRHFGANVGRLFLCFLIFSTGMFISASAFLPSSFSMYMTMLAAGAWYSRMYRLAIFGIATSAIVGWPFAAALGIPIAWDIVYRKKKIGLFISWSIIAAVASLAPIVLLDSHYYGKVVVAPLNIILYNVFSEHGPDIYGVEPWSFYFINGFLNFNFVFLLALVSVPFVILLNFFLKPTKRDLPDWLSLAPMYIWMLIFFTRPHKEERFLYPIYPFFCLAAAVSLDHFQRFTNWLMRGPPQQYYTRKTSWTAVLFCILFATLSLSRSYSLYKSYHAPLEVYSELSQIAEDPKLHDMASDARVNVCVGKEWHRFPGNFFLPDKRWRLRFVKSQFRGQLPKPYSPGPNGTRVTPSHMNDMNLEESSRYIDISKCHYLIDLDLAQEAQYEPRYSQDTKEWKMLAAVKFLDNQRSHKILRAFYVPFVSENHCTYADYVILQSRHYKDIKL